MYILFSVALICSCNKNDSIGFDAIISEQDITFKPVSGGAVMYYTLPNNNQVMSVKVRYTDAQGKEITRVGSYLSDSLLLVGFNEARTGVKANLTLANRNDIESEPIAVSFDTKSSGAYSFFENAKVEPYWYGFSVTYDAPEGANGMGHLFYIGIDPRTQKPDTIFLESFQIEEGSDTIRYILQQKNDKNTIVIRTEDYRGYMVKENAWHDVEAFTSAPIEKSKFTFNTGGLSIEDPERELSVNYLFDGDKKGDVMFANRGGYKYYTFVAGPNAKGAPFIYEFEDNEIPAYINIYAALSVRIYPNAKTDPMWNGTYHSKVPSTIKAYVSNDKNDDNSWELLGSYSQPYDLLPVSLRWSYRVRDYDIINHIRTQEVLDSVEPCFVTIYFPAVNESWKYMKLVFEETAAAYSPMDCKNIPGYVTLHELELHVKSN